MGALLLQEGALEQGRKTGQQEGTKECFSEETVEFWDSCQGDGWEVCGDTLFPACAQQQWTETKQTPLESNLWRKSSPQSPY